MGNNGNHICVFFMIIFYCFGTALFNFSQPPHFPPPHTFLPRHQTNKSILPFAKIRKINDFAVLFSFFLLYFLKTIFFKDVFFFLTLKSFGQHETLFSLSLPKLAEIFPRLPLNIQSSHNITRKRGVPKCLPRNETEKIHLQGKS